MNARAILLAEWLTVIALVTYDEIANNQRVPLPSRYVQSSIVFAVLGLTTPIISDGLAAALGAGLLVALLYKNFTPETAEKANEMNQGGPSFDNGGGQLAQGGQEKAK